MVMSFLFLKSPHQGQLFDSEVVLIFHIRNVEKANHAEEISLKNTVLTLAEQKIFITKGTAKQNLIGRSSVDR